MSSSKFAVLVATCLISASPVMAQGGGGGGGAGGAGGAGAGGGAASSGNAGTGQAAGQNGSNGSSQPNGVQNSPNGQQSPSTTVGEAQKAAVQGTNTQPGGLVSAPGVGVGHTANGKAIGSPGSGPGSPEQPIDGRRLK
jgi:hypothetical protein